MDLHASALTNCDHDASIPLLSAEGTSEAVKFLMELSLDSTRRIKMRQDKLAFISQCDLSEEAKTLIRENDSKLLLSAANQSSSELLVVLVLETVTTDVIVV